MNVLFNIFCYYIMKLTEKQMQTLKKHSTKHKGGMKSKHMKNMLKFMRQGDSFIKAHGRAKKLDK